MEKKLERVISKSEIYELVCKYMRGLDRLDKTIFRSVFHDDAYCDYGFKNRSRYICDILYGCTKGSYIQSSYDREFIN